MLPKILDLLGAKSAAFAERIVPFILILVIGLLAIRIVTRIVNKALSKSKLEKAAHGLIKSLIRVVLLLMVGLTAASSLGIDITGVIALASVLTLAVSLSVQNAYYIALNIVTLTVGIAGIVISAARDKDLFVLEKGALDADGKKKTKWFFSAPFIIIALIITAIQTLMIQVMYS